MKRFGTYFNFNMKPQVVEAVRKIARENDVTPSDVFRELVLIGLKAKGIDFKANQHEAMA